MTTRFHIWISKFRYHNLGFHIQISHNRYLVRHYSAYWYRISVSKPRFSHPDFTQSVPGTELQRISVSYLGNKISGIATSRFHISVSDLGTLYQNPGRVAVHTEVASISRYGTMSTADISIISRENEIPPCDKKGTIHFEGVS